MKNFAERQGMTRTTFISYIITLIVIVCLLQVVKISFLHNFHQYMPITYWFKYDKIETEKKSYEAGTTSIVVNSYANWKREVDVSWNDSLECIKSGVWTSIGNQPWRKVKLTSDNRKTPTPWIFKIPLPDYETVCRIRSSITAFLEFGVRNQILLSNQFMVVDSEFRANDFKQ